MVSKDRWVMEMVPSTWVEDTKKEHILGEIQEFIVVMLDKSRYAIK